MLICHSCRTEVDAAHGFCPRCGSPLDPGGGDAGVAGMVRCGACGGGVEDGMTYCNHCGVELAAAAVAVEPAPMAAAAGAAARAGDDGAERELFRKSNVSYMKDFVLTGVVGYLGTLTITTRRVVFEPSLLNLSAITSLFSKKPANTPLEIRMDEVTGAEPATVLAMNIGVDVVAGAQRYRFSLGIAGGGEAARVVRLINDHKRG